MNPIYAATSVPDSAVAIGGILMVTVVVAVAIWQIFATGRASINARSNAEYRKLAEAAEADRKAADAERTATGETLERMAGDLADVRTRLVEIERLLKDVG